MTIDVVWALHNDTTCPGPSAPPLPAPVHPSHHRYHSHWHVRELARLVPAQMSPNPFLDPKPAQNAQRQIGPSICHIITQVAGYQYQMSTAPTQAALHVVIAVHPTPVGSTLIHSPFLSRPLVKGKLPTLPVLTPGLLRHPKDLSQFGAYEDGSSSSRLCRRAFPYIHLLSS
jgi:hypothetical protein